MTIIRQECFFSIQELYDMQPTQKYNEIISAINMDLIYAKVSKKTKVGAPTELNYPAMIISFFIRYVERIPTIKDLIKRLDDDIAFKLNCGFRDRKSTRLNSSHVAISYAVFCLKKKN